MLIKESQIIMGLMNPDGSRMKTIGLSKRVSNDLTPVDIVSKAFVVPGSKGPAPGAAEIEAPKLLEEAAVAPADGAKGAAGEMVVAAGTGAELVPMKPYHELINERINRYKSMNDSVFLAPHGSDDEMEEGDEEEEEKIPAVYPSYNECVSTCKPVQYIPVKVEAFLARVGSNEPGATPPIKYLQRIGNEGNSFMTMATEPGFAAPFVIVDDAADAHGYVVRTSRSVRLMVTSDHETGAWCPRIVPEKQADKLAAWAKAYFKIPVDPMECCGYGPGIPKIKLEPGQRQYLVRVGLTGFSYLSYTQKNGHEVARLVTNPSDATGFAIVTEGTSDFKLTKRCIPIIVPTYEEALAQCETFKKTGKKQVPVAVSPVLVQTQGPSSGHGAAAMNPSTEYYIRVGSQGTEFIPKMDRTGKIVDSRVSDPAKATGYAVRMPPSDVGHSTYKLWLTKKDKSKAISPRIFPTEAAAKEQCPEGGEVVRVTPYNVARVPKVSGCGVHCHKFLLLPTAPSVSCSCVDALNTRGDKHPLSPGVSRFLHPV